MEAMPLKRCMDMFLKPGSYSGNESANEGEWNNARKGNLIENPE
jgi:hypothetical protein